ncbi:MAG: formimidoylglutamate deiminase [Acidimicrobiia bacterium]|nr:formimidoylglutamate deiminase [Acidimicrobiia bacterium]
MTAYHAAWAWLGGDDLVAHVTIVEEGGAIIEVTTEGPTPHDAVRLEGVVLPGLVNAHSHAFHRALRHRTHGDGGDFWRWRETMLRVAGRLDPDNLAELATAVFAGMALTGITTVAEFHYVHHDVDGDLYRDPNAMGHALVDAAHQAGIRIVLVDTCYLRGGFDAPLEGVPRRFGDGDAERWAERVDLLRRFYREDPMVRIGTAAHSVRTVPPEALQTVVGYAASNGMPFHIHLSEQTAENEAALAATGRSPTQLLHEAGGLGPGTAVVHATHLEPADVARLGHAGVNVVACPTTEADLGDGLGPFIELATAGATLAVGTDQQVSMDLFAEARGIEHHDRLRLRRRGVHSPAALAAAATVGGARAVGTMQRGIAVGAPCDLAVVDPGAPTLAGWSPSDGIAGIVFGGSAYAVTDVVVAGRRIVEAGAHHRFDDVVARIDRAVRAVLA